MSKLNQNSQVLLALAARNVEIPADIDDLTIARYITGELSEQEKQAVLHSLANHPTFLGEMIDLHESLDLFPEENMKDPKAAGAIKKLLDLVFHKVTITGLAFASVSYFMVLPLLTQPSINENLSNSYSMLQLDSELSNTLAYTTKSLNFGQSGFKQDVDFGQLQARSIIQNKSLVISDDIKASKRACENDTDCKSQETAIQLGQWIQLNKLQCDSSVEADPAYWIVQEKVYQALSLKINASNDELPILENSVKADICDVVLRVQRLKF